MNELAHLTDEAREEALLSDAERVFRVRAERWIHYSRAQSVLIRMNGLIEYPPRDRMPCLLLYGATGMGKTKIIRKFLREHPTTFDNHLGISSARVVSMQMPPDPDEKSFYEELLGNLQAPTRFAANTTHLRRIARDLLQFIDARMLIIDEVHALLAGSYRQQRILLNTLRFLATDLRIPLVCAGTEDAKRALTTDQQLADRFEAVELPRWHNDEGFHRLLASFQSILPLRKRSDLVSPLMRRLLLEHTDGVTVRLVRLIEMLAVDAIRSGNEEINQNSLEKLARAPLLSMIESADATVTA
jgi:replication-associated recombination protein RarA